MMGALDVRGDSLSVTCFQGDALTVLRTFPDAFVHCCVTSPPYWGLRDYGTAQWEGGDPECSHSGVARRCDNQSTSDKQKTNKGSSSDPVSWNCLKCGATRIDSQIGLERTPEEYVDRIVEVFREVRRVLRKDGTLWLNLGDSYYNYRSGCQRQQTFHKQAGGEVFGSPRRQTWQAGLKEKDLCGIPWSVALALRSDGWYLRSDIIWSKPNPMPESVADRPTRAHEYLYLLSKSERYYYNGKAISEPAATADPSDPSYRENGKSGGRNRVLIPGQKPHGLYFASSGNKERKQREINQGGNPEHGGHQAYSVPWEGTTRNKRSVWTVRPQPYPDAHFAVFPEDLIRPCILAGCPHGGIVLDPFAGSGTTLLVAQELHCSAVGIDLNPAYVVMANDRIAQEVLPFAAAVDDTMPDEEAMPLPPEPEQLTFDLEVVP